MASKKGGRTIVKCSNYSMIVARHLGALIRDLITFHSGRNKARQRLKELQTIRRECEVLDVVAWACLVSMIAEVVQAFAILNS
jgi:hypothetical protein